MTIRPFPPSQTPRTLPHVAVDGSAAGAARVASMTTDTTQVDTTAYDSVWASGSEIPPKEPEGFEKMMVADGKIYVVLAVVLIIWFSILAFLVRTDRRIRSVERQIEDDR